MVGSTVLYPLWIRLLEVEAGGREPSASSLEPAGGLKGVVDVVETSLTRFSEDCGPGDVEGKVGNIRDTEGGIRSTDGCVEGVNALKCTP